MSGLVRGGAQTAGMYQFTRVRRIDAAHAPGALAWVQAVHEQSKAVSGRELIPWMSVLSPGLGTVVWSLWVEDLTEIEAVIDSLGGDADCRRLVDEGADLFSGPPDDELASLVHGAPEVVGPDAAYLAVVEGTAATGRLVGSLTAGIELAQHATRVSGLPTQFPTNTTGRFGGVQWITGAPDIAALDRATHALAADGGWLELVDRVGADFDPGAVSTIYRRIA